MKRKTKTDWKRFAMRLLIWGVCCPAFITAGCAAPQGSTSAENANPVIEQDDSDFSEFDTLEEELAGKPVTIDDPLEDWNRWMFGANDVLYFWVLKPVAQGYSAVIPEPGRIGIRNFFGNLTTPIRFVNCALQGKFHAAGNEINRLVINTTWGIGGIFDPALEHGKIEQADEDFGQTLAVYGLDNGCYLVWPLFGPSTLRDSAGMGGDYFLNPIYYIEDSKAKIGVSVVRITNRTSLAIGEYEGFKEAAIDPYVAMRNAYIQYRNNQIKE